MGFSGVENICSAHCWLWRPPSHRTGARYWDTPRSSSVSKAIAVTRSMPFCRRRSAVNRGFPAVNPYATAIAEGVATSICVRRGEAGIHKLADLRRYGFQPFGGKTIPTKSVAVIDESICIGCNAVHPGLSGGCQSPVRQSSCTPSSLGMHRLRIVHRTLPGRLHQYGGD